jgi:Zn-dependent protease/CBS domain-containing protein
MGASIRLLSVRGINIRMHITFPLILIWGALQFGLLSKQGLNGAIFGVVVTLLLFIIVLLHELGHSFAAQYYGVEVKQIVLLPIGGVAQLASIPEKPSQEFVIAIAGPLVNFILAMLMVMFGLLVGFRVSPAEVGDILRTMETLGADALFNYLFIANLFLAIFNLLPAFPMDGGRVLRAILASQMSYVRATIIAASIGQALAWVLGLWGFLQGGFFLILIAIFIYLGAGHERQSVQLRHTLGGLQVEQAYSRHVRTLTPQSTLRNAVELTLSSFQADFPVCEGDRLVGLLPYTHLVEALDQYEASMPLAEVMLTDVSAVAPDEEMLVVQQRLAESNLDALPVVDGDRFLGLITNRDISELYRLISSQPDLIPAKAG